MNTRVLHLISSMDPYTGGPARALTGLAKAQKRCGLDVCISSTYARNADLRLVDQLRDHKIDIHMIGPVYTPLALHHRMNSCLEKLVGDADVIHIHALWEQIQHKGAVIARRKMKPYIIRPCGMLAKWSLAQKHFKKQLFLALRVRNNLNKASLIHFTTQMEKELASVLQLEANSIVIPNGLDLSEFSQLPELGRFRKKYPQTRGKLVIAYLGRLHYVKGLELLIPAFAKVKSENTMLVIIGSGDNHYLKKIMSLVKQHGISDQVIFTGMLHGSDRIEALRDSDIFILPSYQENFGIAVAEALAAGLPVLISDQVNLQQEIRHAEVGAVFPNHIDQIADTMVKWINDTELRKATAARSRPFVWENYDWDKIALQWKEMYRKILIP